MSRQKGTVKFFNKTKGYGFIKVDETAQEIFVHVTECMETIKDNDLVEFGTQESQKGINAIDVKKA